MLLALRFRLSQWNNEIRAVIYLQFYTYASQDSLGLYKVSPTRKSLRPLQNFPLLLCESWDSLRFKMWVPKQKCEYRTRDAQVKKSLYEYSRMNEQHTTDQQAGGHMDFQRGNMIPRHYSVTMYNKLCLSGSSLFAKTTWGIFFKPGSNT